MTWLTSVMCDSPFCSLGGKLCKDFSKFFLIFLFSFYVCIKHNYFTVFTRTALFMWDCLLIINQRLWLLIQQGMDRLSHHCEHSYFAKCIGLHSFQIMMHLSAFNHLKHETIIILILQLDLCGSCLQSCILNAVVFSLEQSSAGSLWGELIGEVL